MKKLFLTVILGLSISLSFSQSYGIQVDSALCLSGVFVDTPYFRLVPTIRDSVITYRLEGFYSKAYWLAGAKDNRCDEMGQNATFTGYADEGVWTYGDTLLYWMSQKTSILIGKFSKDMD